jgi:hypothetical protein
MNVPMYYESVKYLEDCNFFVVVKLEVLFGFGKVRQVQNIVHLRKRLCHFKIRKFDGSTLLH